MTLAALPKPHADAPMAWPQASNILQLTRHNDRLSLVYVNAAHIVWFERAKDDITTYVWLDDKHGTVVEVEETPRQIAWAMTGVVGS